MFSNDNIGFVKSFEGEKQNIVFYLAFLPLFLSENAKRTTLTAHTEKKTRTLMQSSHPVISRNETISPAL